MGGGYGVAMNCVVLVADMARMDPALLWLWHMLAAAALIQPLAWEIPCGAGVALKSKTNKQTDKKKIGE